MVNSDGFAIGQRVYDEIDKEESIQISTLFMSPVLFESPRDENFGAFEKAQVVSASNDATGVHIAVIATGQSIARVI